MTEFVVNIPAEKRKLKQLRWSVHIQPNDGGTELHYWILDNKGVMSKHSVQNVTDIAQTELKTCTELIHSVLNTQTQDTKKHVQINLTSSSPFLINVVRDWLDQWSKNNFETRPNQEYLKELHMLKKICKINAAWAQPKTI